MMERPAGFEPASSGWKPKIINHYKKVALFNEIVKIDIFLFIITFLFF